ncbi:MAG: PA2778 family cysteine peptidase [Burkholderiales bacterium]|nr:PA2778 family cysteine peptidase [Burkholderiales bacterium]
MEVPAWLWAGTLLPALFGCATPQVDSLRAQTPADLPRSIALRDVPFFAQEQYQCGPASLAGLLDRTGLTLTPEDLVPQVYLPARKGALQGEMLAATRRQGLIAYELAPQLEALLRELAAGHPTLVLMDAGLTPITRWHYAVATGYDLDHDAIVLNSGQTNGQVMRLERFERGWRASGYWAMLAIAPDELPATARELPYVKAAAALERSVPARAQIAYRTALTRWPDSEGALIGLGNLAYAAHDRVAAIENYRRATAAHPDAADAWNNMALALCDDGQGKDAQTAVQAAIAHGGAHVDAYRRTAQDIAARCATPSK